MARAPKLKNKPFSFCVICEAELQIPRRNLYYCWTCGLAVKIVQKAALNKVKHAVQRGKLPRASTLKCVDCGAPAALYEHRDYDKPLEVEPVCIPCNSKRGPAKSLEKTMLHSKNLNENPTL
jgi:hypothetical protein